MGEVVSDIVFHTYSASLESDYLPLKNLFIDIKGAASSILTSINGNTKCPKIPKCL